MLAMTVLYVFPLFEKRSSVGLVKALSWCSAFLFVAAFALELLSILIKQKKKNLNGKK